MSKLVGFVFILALATTPVRENMSNNPLALLQQRKMQGIRAEATQGLVVEYHPAPLSHLAHFSRAQHLQMPNLVRDVIMGIADRCPPRAKAVLYVVAVVAWFFCWLWCRRLSAEKESKMRRITNEIIADYKYD